MAGGDLDRWPGSGAVCQAGVARHQKTGFLHPAMSGSAQILDATAEFLKREAYLRTCSKARGRPVGHWVIQRRCG